MSLYRRKSKKVINRNYDTTHEDENGYLRYDSDNRLVHRDVAYKFIYKGGFKQGLYNLRFSMYQIHHIDFDKKNNRIANLQILTEEEHEKIHGRKFEWIEKLKH